MLNRVHGGNATGKDIIDFSVNINPQGIPCGLKNILQRNLDILLRYPEPDSEKLKLDLANWQGISPHNILVGNGSIELIHLVPRVFQTKKCLIINPTFSEYEFAVKSHNAKAIFFDTQEQVNFKIDVIKIIKLIPKVDLIFLCNPNNPTGSLMTRDEILSLIEVCKKNNTFLVIDEVFMDFVPEHKNLTLIYEATQNKQVLVLRSLTKFFALPGLRLGYLIGHRDVITKISFLQYPWNVNSLAQLTARIVIKDKSYIERSIKIMQKEKQFLFENLKRTKGLEIFPSSANFFLCKLNNPNLQRADRLNALLFHRGIAIRCCDNFRGLNKRFFRIAVRTRDENKRLILSLSKILA